MKCPRCENKHWNPVLACEQCRYSIEFTLQNPSDYQKEKWFKHGLVYEEGVGTMVNVNAWTGQKTGGSVFAPTIDISSTFTIVAASGATVIPQAGGRSASYMFYLAKPIGAGYQDKKWDYFYGVRIVKPDNEEKIHLFPDNIRSAVDKEVICSRCDKAYKVSAMPKNCSCGNNFGWG